MAGYNLPESGYVNGTTGFFTHLGKVTDIINKFDKDLTPAASDVPMWDGALYVPTPLGFTNVLAYGAIRNDSSGAAITANNTAFAAAAATGLPVLVPAGDWYGTFNLDPTAGPKFFSWFPGQAWIKPATGQYFIDANRQWESLWICNLSFDGAGAGSAGAIRNRYTSTNVTVRHRILDCHFYNYTGAAVSHNSTDFPFWDIQRCCFRGANDTSTIGIAIRGSDGSGIKDCEFQRNRIGVKIGAGTGNVHIENADFIQMNAAVGGNTRVAVWVVPSVSKTISGNGCTVENAKFGNENLGADDRRVVFADEGSGTYFGDKLPNLAADSTGYVNGFSISESIFVGNGTGPHPMIYSTTPNVQGCSVSHIKLLGNQPSMGIQLRTTITDPTSDMLSNIIGPIQPLDNNWTPFPASNQLGMAYLIDPVGILRTNDQPMQVTGGGRSTGYVNLLPARTTGLSVGGTTTKSNITDSIGGADAVEVTYGTGGLFSAVASGSVDATMPAWLEFDCRVGTSSPVAQINVRVKLDTASTGAGNYLWRVVTPPTNWRTYRMPLFLPLVSNNVIIDITPVTGTGKVRLGRIFMYHAQEPLPTGLELRNVITGTTAPAAGGAGALPATPLGYMEVNINGATRKIAYY